MVKVKIIWTESAVFELKNIYEYYKGKVSIIVAGKIKERIFSSVKQLKNYLLSGAIEENLIDTKYEYRYLVEGNYKVIYRYEDKTVYIIDIFDCRRNPLEMKYTPNP